MKRYTAKLLKATSRALKPGVTAKDRAKLNATARKAAAHVRAASPGHCEHMHNEVMADMRRERSKWETTENIQVPRGR